jgi:hypothetical protein
LFAILVLGGLTVLLRRVVVRPRSHLRRSGPDSPACPPTRP